jgi:CBS domain containing-hemolysin-like protein
LKGLVVVFTPLIAVCRLLTRTISNRQTYHAVSGDELIILAKLGHRAGTLDADEAHAIQNILSLKRKTAKEVMTPRTVVFSLNEDQTVKEALGTGPVWRYSRVPVYADDFEDIVGIVLRGEALESLAEGRLDTRLSELMRPVHFVLETASLDRILEMFLERRQHLFVVVDEYGGFSGILTLEDVLEEILGKEIVDELDQVTDMRALARKRRKEVLKDGEDGPAGE